MGGVFEDGERMDLGMVVGMATDKDKGDRGRGQGAAVRAALGRCLETKRGSGVGAGNQDVGRG